MKATSGLASSPESFTLVWNKAKLRADQLERGDLVVELDLMPSLVSAISPMLAALASSISSHGRTVAPSP